MKTVNVLKNSSNKKLEKDIELNDELENHENICKYRKVYKWEAKNISKKIKLNINYLMDSAECTLDDVINEYREEN